MRARRSLIVATMLTGLLGAALVGPAQARLDTNWTLGGQACDLIEVPKVRAATPVGIGGCPGVRPGGTVTSEGGQCTFNFLFTGSDGNRYIGTAGHCILGDSPIGGDAGEQTWAAGSGPDAFDANGNKIGEFAYAILQDPKDFSLIRLDAGVQASPQMCHFGGPTGINSDITSATTVLEHYGNGLGTGQTVPGRSAIAFGLPDPDHVYAEGLVTPGDSGSGIISSDGRAIGVIVTTGFHSSSIGTSGIDVGTMGVTRLAPQLERARQQLGLSSLTLQTAEKL